MKSKVDMSPEAVTARLRQVSQLRDLCVILGEAGRADRQKRAAEKEKQEQTASAKDT